VSERKENLLSRPTMRKRRANFTITRTAGARYLIFISRQNVPEHFSEKEQKLRKTRNRKQSWTLSSAGRHCVLNPENERNSRGHNETVSPSPAQHEREVQTEQKPTDDDAGTLHSCATDAPMTDGVKRYSLEFYVRTTLRLYYYYYYYYYNRTPQYHSPPVHPEPLPPTHRSKLVINRRARGSKRVRRNFIINNIII